MMRRNEFNRKHALRILTSAVVISLLWVLVGRAGAPVTPRVFDGFNGVLLLFDNEEGADQMGVTITFDSPVTLEPQDVIAFGGGQITEIIFWETTIWIAVDAEAGCTLQISLPAGSHASVVSASWSDDPLDRLKALNAQVIAAWNNADLAALETLCDPGYNHSQDAYERNLEEHLQFYAGVTTIFPDHHFTVHDTVAEGNCVASRYTITGTWLEPWWDVPPTGETITYTGAMINCFSDDGQLLATYGNADTLALLQQLGIAPPTGRDSYAWTRSAERAEVPLSAPEANKSLVLESLEGIWGGHNPNAIDDYIAVDYVHHDPGLPLVQDINGYRVFVPATLAAFPDFVSTAEVILAEGDLVAGLFRITGTQLGDYRGLPPTGNGVDYTGIVFFRIENGMIAETWWSLDVLSVLRQLGVIPTPGG